MILLDIFVNIIREPFVVTYAPNNPKTMIVFRTYSVSSHVDR